MINEKTPNAYSGNIIAAVIGILSLMIFGVVPMVQSTFTIPGISEVVTKYKSFSMIFGGTAIGSEITTSLIDGTTTKALLDIYDVKFNMVAFLATTSMIIAIVSAFYISYIKQERERKIFSIIAAIFFVLAGITILLVKESTVASLSMGEYIDNFTLSTGAIISAVLSFISAIISILFCILKK